MRSRVISTFSCLAAAIFFSAIAVAAAQDLSLQTSSAAGVTVKAKPRVLMGAALEFEIVLETHSQDLTDDLRKSATLVVGGSTFVPTAWQGDPPGGHHRKGVLKFSAINPGAQAVELRITRPGETEVRSFRWQIK